MLKTVKIVTVTRQYYVVINMKAGLETDANIPWPLDQ